MYRKGFLKKFALYTIIAVVSSALILQIPAYAANSSTLTITPQSVEINLTVPSPGFTAIITNPASSSQAIQSIELSTPGVSITSLTTQSLGGTCKDTNKWISVQSTSTLLRMQKPAGGANLKPGQSCTVIFQATAGSVLNSNPGFTWTLTAWQSAQFQNLHSIAPSVFVTVVDTVLPTVVRNPAADSCSVPGNLGWCRGEQTAGFTATDTGSGVASPCTGATCNFTQSTATNGAAVNIASGAVCDVAGNCIAGINAGPFSIDSVAPGVVLNPAADSCSVPGNLGWCRDTQTAGFTASDATSGVASPCTGATCNFTQSTATNGAAVNIASGLISDVAGNTNLGINAGPFTIDSFKPSTPTDLSPPDGAVINLNNILFDWEDVADGPAGTESSGVLYDIFVANHDNVVNGLLQPPYVFSDTGLTESQKQVTGINIDAYHWQVVSRDVAGNDPASILRSFTTISLDGNTLVEPLGGGIFQVTVGGQSCLKDPITGECLPVEVTVNGGLITVKTGVFRVDFDSSQPSELCVSDPRVTLPDPNQVCKEWVIQRVGDTSPLSQQSATIQAFCDDDRTNPLSGVTNCLRTGTVIQTNNVCAGVCSNDLSNKVGTLKITNTFGETAQFGAEFTEDPVVSAQYRMYQSVAISPQGAVTIVILGDKEFTPSQLCNELTQIDLLDQQVISLGAQGLLNGGQVNSFQSQLSTARDALNIGDRAGAVAAMGAFINHAQSQVASGKLQPQIAQDLEDVAQNIIDNINDTSNSCFIGPKLGGVAFLIRVDGLDIFGESWQSEFDKGKFAGFTIVTGGSLTIKSNVPEFTGSFMTDPAGVASTSDKHVWYASGSCTSPSGTASASSGTQVMRLRSALSGSTGGTENLPVCSEPIFVWSLQSSINSVITGSAATNAAGIRVTGVTVGFTIPTSFVINAVTYQGVDNDRNCKYTDISGDTPGTASGTLYTDAKNNPAYWGPSSECQSAGTKSFSSSLQNNASTSANNIICDVDSKVALSTSTDVNGVSSSLSPTPIYFLMGMTFADMAQEAADTDYVNVYSFESSSDPTLVWTYDVSTSLSTGC